MSFLKTLSPPVVAIVFARILYAINWFNIGSIFYLIAEDFKQDVSMLGMITTSFLIGIGIFQIFAGIIAVKYNPKKIIVFGIMLLSTSTILCGFTSEIIQMVILRFLVGTGMAFFFGPGVILISKYLGKGTEGLGIGILNSGHSIGGIIGLFVWIIVAQVTDWRISLEISGILGCISGFILFYELEIKEKLVQRKKNKVYFQKTTLDNTFDNQDKNNINRHSNHKSKNLRQVSVKHDDVEKSHKNTDIFKKDKTDFKINIIELKKILVNKSMINTGLALLGIQIGWGLISTFTVLYLKDYLQIDPLIGGSVVCVAMISNVISAPIIGKIYDKIITRYGNNKAIVLLIICNIMVSFNIFLFSLKDIHIIFLASIFIGIFASGGFVIPYANARQIIRHKIYQSTHYEILAVSYVNGISLSGAFWAPILFASTATYINYDLAWIIGGLITLIFLIPSMKLLYKT